MKVWIILSGDRSDATGVDGVFATRGLAEACVLEMIDNRHLGHDAGDWKRGKSNSFGRTWEAGIADFISIESFEVVEE